MAQKKKSTSPWVWLFLLLVLGSFVAFVLFLDKKIIKSGTGDSQQQESSGSENKPTIDFYSVLPQRKVEIPIDEEDRDAIENPSIWIVIGLACLMALKGKDVQTPIEPTAPLYAALKFGVKF